MVCRSRSNRHHRVDTSAELIDAEMHIVVTCTEPQWKAFSYLRALPNDEDLIERSSGTGESYFALPISRIGTQSQLIKDFGRRLAILQIIVDSHFFVNFTKSQWKAFSYLKTLSNDEDPIQESAETGKSCFVTRIIRIFLKIAERGRRTEKKHLICAHSNGAINNLADIFRPSGFSTLYWVIIRYANTTTTAIIEPVLFIRRRNRLWTC